MPNNDPDIDDEIANRPRLLAMATQIVSAYVKGNRVQPGDLQGLINGIYRSLSDVRDGRKQEATAELVPAVPIRKSVTPDYIVCLEDGKKLKMLKRHLRTSFGMTPEEYRAKWRLPADYPMTAPNYAARRSAFAKQIGLGRESGPRRRGERTVS
jgi:predicted transcriptional regulator